VGLYCVVYWVTLCSLRERERVCVCERVRGVVLLSGSILWFDGVCFVILWVYMLVVSGLYYVVYTKERKYVVTKVCTFQRSLCLRESKRARAHARSH